MSDATAYATLVAACRREIRNGHEGGCLTHRPGTRLHCTCLVGRLNHALRQAHLNRLED